MKPRLTLYGRSHCGLCEQMWHELEALPERERFDLETVDIDSQPALIQRYGTLIPVLAAGGQELCHYFLDPEVLRRYFETL